MKCTSKGKTDIFLAKILHQPRSFTTFTIILLLTLDCSGRKIERFSIEWNELSLTRAIDERDHETALPEINEIENSIISYEGFRPILI